ncbi:hypothetical protein [Butyrivibrio sp. INlla16]|uniref:hypothetical protein n=1 Tax=Butyrivibrio sp. INlla16 TaxID=1520807 RepID=UPI000889D170|nr:hypothetical protein [Butyrivibrio sp. INlla16]SDB62656.1 hypothetical protein SAMN02910263_03392 [Butyrivibrio sp. INlla16]
MTKRIVGWVLLIFGIIILASFVFLMTADFHIIAFIFQLFIPYFLGPVLLTLLPFILIAVGIIIVIWCVVSHRKKIRNSEKMNS